MEGCAGCCAASTTATTPARSAALGPAAAIVDALAAVGLLEVRLSPPGADGAEDGPIAWLEASEAIVDKERDAVVLAGSEIIEVFPPDYARNPPEHEGRD